MKFSVFLPQGFVFELAGRSDPVEAFDAMVRVARAVDDAGYDTLWVADHFMTAMPSQEMMFECWTTVAALTRETRRVRIGQLVTCNGYRNPALQAKMASTVDVMAGGRYTFGIGSGYYEPEFTSYGYPFPDSSERLRQLREAVQVILALWTEEEATFEGRYYQVRGAINQPKGVQRPHIPLLVAGGGEKVTLKIVAQYADACNVTDTPAELERKFAVLKKHCAEVGRDYDAIHRTVQTHCVIADDEAEARSRIPQWAPAVFPGDIGDYGLIGTVDTIRERIAAYEAAGVQELVISFPDTVALDSVKRFADEFIA
ncbi:MULTISPECIES: LLM class F420-dependent oxidoreductase [unclassified Saccharothrix]|uniref:LLM class F420-dependent oxidoreductase n=1 Tax=unclassified Saccharothrix TaxID=2593673 RepID=UPI00307F5B4D